MGVREGTFAPLLKFYKGKSAVTCEDGKVEDSRHVRTVKWRIPVNLWVHPVIYKVLYIRVGIKLGSVWPYVGSGTLWGWFHSQTAWFLM